MSARFPFSCVLTTTAPGAEVDDMGDAVEVLTSTPTVCDAQQQTATEAREGGLVAVTSWQIFLPDGPVPKAGDRVDLDDGRRFSLDGDGWKVLRLADGSVSHLEANARIIQ